MSTQRLLAFNMIISVSLSGEMFALSQFTFQRETLVKCDMSETMTRDGRGSFSIG